MLFNKNEYTQSNSKKVLHKVRKHWVAISLAIVSMLGGTALAKSNTQSVHADDINQNNTTQENANTNQNNNAVLVNQSGNQLFNQNASDGIQPSDNTNPNSDVQSDTSSSDNTNFNSDVQNNNFKNNSDNIPMSDGSNEPGQMDNNAPYVLNNNQSNNNDTITNKANNLHDGIINNAIQNNLNSNSNYDPMSFDNNESQNVTSQLQNQSDTKNTSDINNMSSNNTPVTYSDTGYQYTPSQSSDITSLSDEPSQSSNTTPSSDITQPSDPNAINYSDTQGQSSNINTLSDNQSYASDESLESNSNANTQPINNGIQQSSSDNEDNKAIPLNQLSPDSVYDNVNESIGSGGYTEPQVIVKDQSDMGHHIVFDNSPIPTNYMSMEHEAEHYGVDVSNTDSPVTIKDSIKTCMIHTPMNIEQSDINYINNYHEHRDSNYASGGQWTPSNDQASDQPSYIQPSGQTGNQSSDQPSYIQPSGQTGNQSSDQPSYIQPSGQTGDQSSDQPSYIQPSGQTGDQSSDQPSYIQPSGQTGDQTNYNQPYDSDGPISNGLTPSDGRPSDTPSFQPDNPDGFNSPSDTEPTNDYLDTHNIGVGGGPIAGGGSQEFDVQPGDGDTIGPSYEPSDTSYIDTDPNDPNNPNDLYND